jgi:hypothetical protein
VKRGMWWLLSVLGAAQLFAAETPLRVCIYGDNRGANPVHRAILQQAAKVRPRFFVIAGDILKYNYRRVGTPEAVLRDYRSVFGTRENPLTLWPAVPGPVIFPVAGGHDEQYFLAPAVAAAADTTRGRRYAYEGTPELGMQLYEVFNLDQMRIRVQPLSEMSKPLPMSPYGDYLVVVGSGTRRDCGLLVLYRTDRWGFRPDQIEWVDSTLEDFRNESPDVPLLVVGHDGTWLLPDTLDDGHRDGINNGVRTEDPQMDRAQKRRLADVLKIYHADVEIASDSHEYWATMSGALLRLNCGAAICKDVFNEKVAADNVWIEYSQDDRMLQVTVHAIDPPVGCGLRPEAAALGTAFEKNRAANSLWQTINP